MPSPNKDSGPDIPASSKKQDVWKTRAVVVHIFQPVMHFWQNMSWRAKSMTFVLLLVALIYLSISIFLYTSVRNDLTNQVQTELLRLTETLASSAADPLLLKDGGKLGKLAELHNPLVQTVVITNSRNVVVASPDIRQLGQTLPSYLSRANAHQADHFAAPVLAGGNQLGAVYLQGNQKHINRLVNQRLDRTTSRLIVLGLITALLGLLGAYLVSLAMTRPVLRLLDEIESMEDRLGLDKKFTLVRTPQSGDELYRLEWAFRFTEQRLREHLLELRQLHQRQQAMQCMATIGEMSAQVAHEIRNALSSLRGAARYLVRYGQADNQGDFIRIIEEEVQRLYDMTQGFLDFGRPYAAIPVDTQIRHLLERCLSRHRADLETKTIMATLDCPESLHAMLDPSLIEQALSNLILNAIDALPMQDGELHLAAEKSGLAQLDIMVSDNGPGIPPEKRKNIFKPYVTTKTKGSGLGLAVVTKIMMVHDGSVELCETHSGARFILHLPCKPPLSS
jgi:signal transduction histidine kinase